MSEFSFTKDVGRDSPDLFVSVCKGDHHDEAVLTVDGLSSDVKGKLGFYKVTFTNVLIGSVSLAGQDNSVPQEQVSLNFSKVEIEFKDVKGGGKVQVCDFTTGDF